MAAISVAGFRKLKFALLRVPGIQPGHIIGDAFIERDTRRPAHVFPDARQVERGDRGRTAVPGLEREACPGNCFADRIGDLAVGHVGWPADIVDRVRQRGHQLQPGDGLGAVRRVTQVPVVIFLESRGWPGRPGAGSGPGTPRTAACTMRLTRLFML